MRCLIVSCVFPPEPVVSSQTSAQIAKELVSRGHHAMVITSFPSRPAGKPYPGYSRKLLKREVSPAGFELIRCFSFFSAQSRMVSRFLENISFGITGGWVAVILRRPDIIYANTWPIFATGILFIVAQMRRIPIVINVQDIYPDSLVSQQRIRANGWLARWMRWVDRAIVRRCREVIVISEYFATIYSSDRGVSPERLHVVPNWMDKQLGVSDDGHGHQFRTIKKIPLNAFLVIYGGNIGIAAGVETIIESFRTLREIDNLYLVIAGEGGSLKACQLLASEIGCSRIIFHTPWPKDETEALLNAADLLILPTKHNQSLVSVPSKLISYMLAARPVIAMASVQSDLGQTINSSGCGWLVEPDDPKMLANKIKKVMSIDPAELKRRGKAGREFALANFTREVCLPKVISIIEQAAHRDE